VHLRAALRLYRASRLWGGRFAGASGNSASRDKGGME